MSGVRYFYLDEAASPAVVTARSHPEQTPPDPTTWPAPWPAFWAKVPPQADVVLTDLDLGLDLLGQGDKRRSLLWRRLITDLGWSGQNRIAFWPMAIPQNGATCPDPALFRQGLQLLAPKCVAFFGMEATVPFSTEPTPQALTALLGLPCVVLPDPNLLLQDDKEDWDAVLAALCPL